MTHKNAVRTPYHTPIATLKPGESLQATMKFSYAASGEIYIVVDFPGGHSMGTEADGGNLVLALARLAKGLNLVIPRILWIETKTTEEQTADLS